MTTKQWLAFAGVQAMGFYVAWNHSPATSGVVLVSAILLFPGSIIASYVLFLGRLFLIYIFPRNAAVVTFIWIASIITVNALVWWTVSTTHARFTRQRRSGDTSTIE